MACCAVLRGSVADGLARVGGLPWEVVVVEHPSGVLDIELQTEGHGAALVVRQAGLVRTARPLFRGKVLIPPSVWAGTPATWARGIEQSPSAERQVKGFTGDQRARDRAVTSIFE